MKLKSMVGAAALTAALAFGAPAFADDNDMTKPADQPMHHHVTHHHAMHHHPMHHHAVHHHAMHHHHHHHAMHEHHMAHHAAHHRHHDMSRDARERAETKRLNEEQARKGGM